MKRGILILLFIFILAYSVGAFIVSIEDPGSPLNGTADINITISELGEGENVNLISLYYRDTASEDEPWQIIGWVGSTENLTSCTIEFDTTMFDNTDDGYLNATAVNNSEGQEIVGSTLRQIIINNELNNPPTCDIASDTNKTTNEDTGTDIDSDMDASGGIECTDEDEDDLTYAVNTQSGVGSFSIIENNLSASPQANATGVGYATIGVTDGTDTVYVDVQVTWDAVNDPPYLSAIIPNQTWDENDDKTIYLDDYFFDVDDSSLNYSYDFTSSSPDINVTIDSDGDTTFTPDTDWTGTEKLTFTAMDSSNASVTSNEVILTVEEANETTTNTAPNIDTVSPETDPTISVGESQRFTITKSDPDGDDMNVTWRVDGLPQKGETGNVFSYTASEIGTFVIKVTVSDGQASDKNSWTLTVKAVGADTNRTVGRGEEETEEETSVCGDGVCDDDETTTSCCKDCGCPDGWKCSTKTNKCTREKKAGNTILLIVIGVLFAGGAGAGIYFYKKKQEKDIFGLAKTPFKTPPKEVKGEVKPQKPAEIVKQKPAAVVKQPKKPVTKPKTTSQVLLKKYINYNMRKGKSFEQIKKELLKVGWTAEQIDDAYTAAKLDEVFS